MLAHTVICCRVTPSQKARVVLLVKATGRRTLAVGDGGNDVAMIQAADVGVGIAGREGLQAARASDYSIGQFRFLRRLVLVHGRYSYIRTALIGQYCIYKSLVLAFVQLLFALDSGLSGASLLNSFSLMAYNVLYTGVPILFFVLNKDMEEDVVFTHPQLMRPVHQGRPIGRRVLMGWFARAVYHSLVVYYVALYTFSHERTDHELFGLVAFSICVWIQTLVVAMETTSFTAPQHVAIWGTLVFFYASMLAVSCMSGGGMYRSMQTLMADPAYWLSCLLASVMALAPLVANKYVRFQYWPNLLHKIQRNAMQQRYGLVGAQLAAERGQYVEGGGRFLEEGSDGEQSAYGDNDSAVLHMGGHITKGAMAMGAAAGAVGVEMQTSPHLRHSRNAIALLNSRSRSEMKQK
mmetsp:Transcript_36023/g.113959  ORF Transcript_36023/g.113959 Transcript_36023/m.113959 type:complete len:407 (+) Transcript_36023:267-1487(+)